MRTLKLFFAPLLFATFVLAGCDSSVMDDEDVMASLRLEPVVNGQPFATGQTYQINGTAVNFGSARLYVSGITLIAEDGSEIDIEADSPLTVPARTADGADITHTVSDRVLLYKHDLGHDEHSIGMVPTGRYSGMRFKVGIAGTDNRIDASQVAAGHPLAKQTDKNNHWSWNSGYIYLRVDGLADSDADGTPDEVWETHLGTTNFVTDVTLNQAFEITEDANQLHAMVNYGAIMGQVDLSNAAERLCHTMNNLPVAQKVGSSIAGSVMFHGVHEGAHSHM